MRTHLFRNITVAVASTIMLSGLAIAPVTAEAAPVTISPTMSSIQDAYRNVFVPALAVQQGWTGDAASCSAGTTSSAARDATLTVVNYYRALAGLPSVTENAAATLQAQQAALVMTANGSLNHNPPSNWKCWTQTAYDSAYISNLGGGSPTGGASIVGYMDDDDTPSVGHRVAVLYPPLAQVGIGMAGWGYALQYRSSELLTGPKVTTGVPWPAAGYFPYENLPKGSGSSPSNGYWSYARTGADFTNATVSVTKNGTALTVTNVHSERNTVGGLIYRPDATLIWTMPAMSAPPANGYDTYHVTISGSVNDSYDVEVFTAALVTIGSASISGTPSVGSTLTANVSSISPSDAQLSYAWYSGSTLVNNSKTYKVGLSDAGQTLTVKITGNKTNWTTSSEATASVNIPALVTTSGTVTSTDGSSVSGTALTYDNVSCDTHDNITSSNGTDHWGTVQATVNGSFSFSSIPGQCYQLWVSSPTDVWTTVNGSDNFAYVTAGSSSVAVTVTHVMVSGVSMIGSVQVGQAIGFRVDAYWPNNASLSYQWLRDGQAILGATGESYSVVVADYGHQLSLCVTAKYSGYTTQATSSAATVKAGLAPEYTATISGTAAVGETLTTPMVTATGWTTTYQWLRNGEAISGATNPVYSLVPADANTNVSVRVEMSRPAYTTGTSTSAAVSVKPGAAVSFTPTVTGSGTIGNTLTVSANAPAGWTVASYQWLRDGQAITGATRSTYRTVGNDNGHAITVRVSLTRSGYTTSNGTSAAVAAQCQQFTDVPLSHTFYESICWASAYSVTKGTGDGSTYSPSNPVNRGSMAAFLYRLAGSPKWDPPETSPFVDVKTTDTFYPGITWLYSQGITVGTTVNGKVYYQPNNAVNRGSMSAFLYRFASSPAWTLPATSPFADVTQTNTFYKSITWLADKKITVGSTSGGKLVYQPGNPVNRGSMSAFMLRLTKTQLQCTRFPTAIGC